MNPIITLEHVDGHLFDTIRLDRSQNIMFCIPVGQIQNSKIKGFEDTNLVRCGMLPAPEIFEIKKINAALFRNGKPLSPFDKEADHHWTRTTIELRVMMRGYGMYTPFQIADPICIMGGRDPEEIRDTLREFPDLVSSLSAPVVLGQCMPFCVEVCTEIPDPDLTLQVSFRGSHYRAIQ